MKYFCHLTCLSALLLTHAATAFDNVKNLPVKPLHSLNYGVFFEPHLREQSHGIIGPALQLVAITLGPKVTLSSTESQNFDFIIEVTDQASIEKLSNQQKYFLDLHSSLRPEGHSLLVPNDRGHSIVLRIAWDKLMTHSQQNNKGRILYSDAYARLVAFLGHEISGSIPYLIRNQKLFESQKFLNSPSFRAQTWIKYEYVTLASEVEFLSNLIKKFGSELRFDLVRDLNQILRAKKKQLAQLSLSKTQSQPKRNVLTLPGRRACKLIYKN